MKKILIVLCVLLAIVGCSKTNVEEPEKNPETMDGGVGIVNPMKESTFADLQTKGFTINLPEEVQTEDVKCFYYDPGDDSMKMAEFRFNYQGSDINYRIKISSETEPTDISGLYNTYESEVEAEVDNRSAVAKFNNDKDGYITWFDRVVGVDYSLSMSANANATNLITIATALYSPLQGNAK